jgi:hypothetical protein
MIKTSSIALKTMSGLIFDDPPCSQVMDFSSVEYV